MPNAAAPLAFNSPRLDHLDAILPSPAIAVRHKVSILRHRMCARNPRQVFSNNHRLSAVARIGCFLVQQRDEIDPVRPNYI
jgi:hypothetical protein